MTRRLARLSIAVLFVIVFSFGLSCSREDSSYVPETTCECRETLPNETPEIDPYETIVEEFELLATSGNRIYGLIRRPDPGLYPDRCFAAVVYIPGGINPGRLLALGNEARLLSQAGMVVLTFNAEGRGEDIPEDRISEGEIDSNGYRDQDALSAVIEYAAELDYVVRDNIGVKTQSFGIAMGAGCLARHQDLPVKYLVDGEGPPNSFVTAQEPWSLDTDTTNDKHETVYGILGHYSTVRDTTEANRLWWGERDAIRFIRGFNGRYLRLQAEWDHSQPPSTAAEVDTFNQPPLWWQCKHTTDIVNAAVAGGVPWVRVNMEEHGNPINATYSESDSPVYLPGELADQTWDVRAILEMARLP
ncbi:MAG: hypothetical protein KAY32_09910 [Candidatus Eisenbacteria sp.]|nr:hypothetical protein [Candidatus Eisenbacteria bacterium]